MKAALHLAGPDDLGALTSLARTFHTEEGADMTDDDRDAGLRPLVEGIPHGAAYLIGPARAPIGYIVVTFAWSVQRGGMEGYIDEIYLRPAVRSRGIATEVVQTLGKVLSGAGVTTLHVRVDLQNEKARRLYARNGFEPDDRRALLSREF